MNLRQLDALSAWVTARRQARQRGEDADAIPSPLEAVEEEVSVGFVKAIRKAAKGRVALVGPSNSGKTYTALSIAEVLAAGGTVAVIDTEHGSASKYSDDFNFVVQELDTFSPDILIASLKEAEELGAAVCVIDSLSHFWMGTDGMLDQVSKQAKRKNYASEFPAWKDVGPKEKASWDAILQSRMHVIATLRTKTEYVIDEVEIGNGRTKKVPRKVGLAPVQRQGLEYEFDIVADLDPDQNFVVSKTRCKALNGYFVHHAGSEFASTLRDWLDGGAQVEAAPDHTDREALFDRLVTVHGSREAAQEACKRGGIGKATPVEEVQAFVELQEAAASAEAETRNKLLQDIARLVDTKRIPAEDVDSLVVQAVGMESGVEALSAEQLVAVVKALEGYKPKRRVE
jgi:hypothetical protein